MWVAKFYTKDATVSALILNWEIIEDVWHTVMDTRYVLYVHVCYSIICEQLLIKILFL